MDISRDDFINAIKKRPFHLRDCAICGYELSFCFRDGQLGYDAGCYCVSYNGWRSIPDDHLDFYLDPAHGHLEKIRAFIKSVQAEG